MLKAEMFWTEALQSELVIYHFQRRVPRHEHRSERVDGIDESKLSALIRFVERTEHRLTELETANDIVLSVEALREFQKQLRCDFAVEIECAVIHRVVHRQNVVNNAFNQWISGWIGGVITIRGGIGEVQYGPDGGTQRFGIYAFLLFEEIGPKHRGRDSADIHHFP